MLGLGLAAYVLLLGRRIPSIALGPEAGPVPPQALQAPSAVPGAPAAGPEPTSESLPETPLPPLAGSDAIVRELASGLAAQPSFSAWLSVAGLIRRFVGVVDNIAEGVSPRSNLSFLPLGGAFQTVTRGGRLYVDPRSYERYDASADVLASLDPQRAVGLYRKLQPLCEDAYRELGHPQGRFEDAVAGAMHTLLATPIVEGEIEVSPKVVTYAFADPRLEALNAAQKHLLRMGPRNVRLVQAKVRALAAALGMVESDLPRANVQ